MGPHASTTNEMATTNDTVLRGAPNELTWLVGRAPTRRQGPDEAQATYDARPHHTLLHLVGGPPRGVLGGRPRERMGPPPTR